MSEDTNAWVSFSQVADPPAAAGLCLLVPAWTEDRGGTITVKRSKVGAALGDLPSSARFARGYSAGVLLVTDQDDLSQAGDLTGLPEPDVELAQQLNYAVQDLLGCVHGGMFRLRANGTTTDVVLNPHPMEVETEIAGLDFAFIVGHGAADSGEIGGLSASALDEKLTDWDVKEAVVLVCTGGCPNIGGALSSKRVVVACGAPVDTRAAYIFGLNYLWKRFGDGASPAQALGASNVVLPRDPYQLWHNGNRM